MENIVFSQNWNNKLLCGAFTTVRMENPDRYRWGGEYTVVMGRHQLGSAKIVMLKTLYYKDLTEGMSMVDTGRPLPYLLKLLDSFYPSANWSVDRLNWMVLEYTDRSSVQRHMVSERVRELGIPFTPNYGK